ncbi:signal peptide protein [Afipia sp. P52-10]|nr:signal peptide protein [Afipia sp. P52-10]
MGRFVRCSLALAMFLPLAACAGGSGEETYFARPRNAGAPQPFPVNYRADLLAFLRTYLNDPTNVRDASISEPVQRFIGGANRYVLCVRYDTRDSSGHYTGTADRAALYLDGRFDRMIEKPQDLCPATAYAPFPELEKLKR